MAGEVQGIGLMIGDTLAVAAGCDADGPCWEVSQPARVCVPSPADPVELLLAGDEALAAGMEPLLTTPRRRGYAPGAPAVATELLAALLATVRQQVPPASLERPARPPVLALAHTLSGRQAELVTRAAARAGWGEVRVVSELAALAALQAPPQAQAKVAVSMAADGMLHTGHFSVQKDAGLSLAWEGLESARAPGAAGTGPDDERNVARGAARLALGAPFAGVTLCESLPVELALNRPEGAPISLMPAGRPGRLVRALCPPPPDGVMLELVACAGGKPFQLVAQVPLEPTRAPARGGAPWLLTLTVISSLQGRLQVQTESGATVAEQAFSIRLP